MLGVPVAVIGLTVGPGIAAVDFAQGAVIVVRTLFIGRRAEVIIVRLGPAYGGGEVRIGDGQAADTAGDDVIARDTDRAVCAALDLQLDNGGTFQSVSGATSFFASAVIVQKRKRIVKALASAERALTHIATWVVSDANRLKKWPMSMKNGAPGGWPTSSFQAEEMNSPQSQKDAVGSIVRRYVAAAMAKTSHPQSLFHNLKFFIFLLFY